MKSIMLLACSLMLFSSCKENTVKDVSEDAALSIEISQSSYELEVYNFSELEPFLNKKDNKTYVVNFWATWCAPCIKELPYFEQVNAKYKNENVEVLLVSLDFPKLYEKKLIPFIKNKNLKSKVVALNDTKMNDWIPKIDENWSGAIPATIIYNKKKSQFYERSFNFEELEAELKKFITP